MPSEAEIEAAAGMMWGIMFHSGDSPGRHPGELWIPEDSVAHYARSVLLAAERVRDAPLISINLTEDEKRRLRVWRVMDHPPIFSP
jgi:hypothetical protein